MDPLNIKFSDTEYQKIHIIFSKNSNFNKFIPKNPLKEYLLTVINSLSGDKLNEMYYKLQLKCIKIEEDEEYALKRREQHNEDYILNNDSDCEYNETQKRINSYHNLLIKSSKKRNSQAVKRIVDKKLYETDIKNQFAHYVNLLQIRFPPVEKIKVYKQLKEVKLESVYENEVTNYAQLVCTYEILMEKIIDHNQEPQFYVQLEKLTDREALTELLKDQRILKKVEEVSYFINVKYPTKKLRNLGQFENVLKQLVNTQVQQELHNTSQVDQFIKEQIMKSQRQNFKRQKEIQLEQTFAKLNQNQMQVLESEKILIRKKCSVCMKLLEVYKLKVQKSCGHIICNQCLLMYNPSNCICGQKLDLVEIQQNQNIVNKQIASYSDKSMKDQEEMKRDEKQINLIRQQLVSHNDQQKYKQQQQQQQQQEQKFFYKPMQIQKNNSQQQIQCVDQKSQMSQQNKSHVDNRDEQTILIDYNKKNDMLSQMSGIQQMEENQSQILGEFLNNNKQKQQIQYKGDQQHQQQEQEISPVKKLDIINQNQILDQSPGELIQQQELNDQLEMQQQFGQEEEKISTDFNELNQQQYERLYEQLQILIIEEMGLFLDTRTGLMWQYQDNRFINQGNYQENLLELAVNLREITEYQLSSVKTQEYNMAMQKFLEQNQQYYQLIDAKYIVFNMDTSNEKLEFDGNAKQREVQTPQQFMADPDHYIANEKKSSGNQRLQALNQERFKSASGDSFTKQFGGFELRSSQKSKK